MDRSFAANGLRFTCHLARPIKQQADRPCLVLCHGFPSGELGASGAAHSFPDLADRVAEDLNWTALTFAFRGCGGSDGDFSIAGWLEDLEAAIAYLRKTAGVERLWLAGFGSGGAVCIAAGAADPQVSGVAALAAPADYDDWASHPRRLLQHAREIGAIRSSDYPASIDGWAKEFRALRLTDLVAQLAPRPLLVMHGSEDEAVPHFDARALSDAHRSAELRIIGGAGHQLRHDPRAIAVLLGWLERQRHPERESSVATPPNLSQ